MDADSVVAAVDDNTMLQSCHRKKVSAAGNDVDQSDIRQPLQRVVADASAAADAIYGREYIHTGFDTGAALDDFQKYENYKMTAVADVALKTE